MGKVEQSELISAIEHMPKVELHVHFAGAISAETIEKLARKNGVDIGNSEDNPDISGTRYRHLIDFLDSYRLRCKCLQTAEDFETACIDILKGFLNQKVKYAEIIESPTAFRLHGVPVEVIMSGITAGVEKVCANGEIDVRFIFDIGRQFGPEHAWKTVREAAQSQEAGVIAVGVGGDEVHYSPEIFTEQFEFARKEGLHRVAHAGEVGGSQSIWGALNALGVERIGHGVAARGDEELLEYLMVKAVPIEMCPTSNIKTGAVRSYSEHPLPEFLQRGLLMTLSTDDPAMFGTSITEEYRVCVEELGLGWDEIKTLCLNGVRGSFLPDLDKARLLEQFEDELSKIESETGIG